MSYRQEIAWGTFYWRALYILVIQRRFMQWRLLLFASVGHNETCIYGGDLNSTGIPMNTLLAFRWWFSSFRHGHADIITQINT